MSFRFVVVVVGRRRCFLSPSLLCLYITHDALYFLYVTQVNLDDRKDDDWPWLASLYVDCVDTIIEEPDKSDPWWYSHKSNGPGLRYELGTSIQSGLICWVNGPWRAGLWPDETIFRRGLYFELEDNEPVLADRGYRQTDDDGGELVFFTPNTPGLTDAHRRAYGRVHARHEGVNGKLKKFAVLSDRFRHDLDLHGECFFAVVALVQVSMMVEETPYEVNYEE